MLKQSKKEKSLTLPYKIKQQKKSWNTKIQVTK